MAFEISEFIKKLNSIRESKFYKKEMILLPAITLILLFCFYQKRNRFRFGITNLLILSYVVMACISLILEQSGKFKSVFPISFEPMAYFSICLIITFWGFTGFRDQKFTTIKIENIYFYRILEAFLLIGGLFAMAFYLPFAYDSITGDIDLNRLTVVEEGSNLGRFGIINSIFAQFANLFILNQVCSFINLFPRKNKPNFIMACLMLSSSLSYVIYILAYVGRDGIVFWIMSFFFCYLLFQGFLARNVLRKLKFLFVLILTLLLVPFVLITIARFTSFEEGVGWWILHYGGNQIRLFNDHYLVLEMLGFGRMGFPVFVDLFEIITLSEIQAFDKAEIFLQFTNNGVAYWGFSTFIGSIMLDLGKVGTLIFLCLFSFFTRIVLKTVSKKGVLDFSNILILTLLYQIVYWGVFYFKQYATNYYMIFIILLFSLFKLSYMKRLSVHYFKLKSTQ